jgi:hypothetical protein
MSATSIVVELLVVGFLCFLSLTALFAVAAGFDMEQLLMLTGRIELPFQLAAPMYLALCGTDCAISVFIMRTSNSLRAIAMQAAKHFS